MNFLAKLLPIFLDWTVRRITPIIVHLFNEWKTNKQAVEREEARLDQADIVNKIRLEILELRNRGVEVPEELKERFRVESRKLINS